MNTKKESKGYEPTTIRRPWLIASGVIGFVLFAAVSMGALYLFFNTAAPEETFHISVFAAPRLQIDPAQDLRRVDAAQADKLTRTTWRDRKAGVLTIPIDAAMAVIAKRGSDAYDPLPAAAAASPAGGRPAAAMAPDDRRPNPGSGQPDPMQEGR